MVTEFISMWRDFLALSCSFIYFIFHSVLFSININVILIMNNVRSN